MNSIEWPEALTPELRDILGRQCFTLIKMSQTYRLAGFDIPQRAEEEQAFLIHRFLTHWFKSGADWQRSMSDELQDVVAKARTNLASSPKSEGTEPANQKPEPEYQTQKET